MKISRIKELKNFCLAATILVAGASLASCSSSDDIAENNQQPVENPTAPKIYTMTIQASKGDGATTRALTLSGSTLNATWATTENVYVKKGSDWADGSLQPQAGGTTATLKGKLSKVAINPNDELTLQFPRSGAIDYTGQVGTLDDIAANYDYATASVTVASVNDGNITPKDDANFVNQQAIVKFTLMDKDKANNYAAINATQLVVNVGTTNYTINPASATDVIYVAIPGFSGQTVTLTATVGSYTYTYQKLDVTFINGKYYEITVKMTKDPRYDNEVNINTYVGSKPIDVPTGKHWLIKGNVDGEGNVEGTSNQITIEDDATVTLSNVNISSDSYCIKCVGNATIILADGSTNKLTCSGALNENPALWAGESGKTLTIKGTGGIEATGGYYTAGIGSGGVGKPCGHIVIEGGFITATGGAYAAGIGSGDACGNITITGGTIEATGGTYAAGIGSGYMGTCQNISISGSAKVEAMGRDGGAGIGSGSTQNNATPNDVSMCGNISISGSADVTATGGDGGAGIGTGEGSKCGNITIENTVTKVKATKGGSAPNSIGAGVGGSCGMVTIGGVEGAINDSPYTYQPVTQ